MKRKGDIIRGYTLLSDPKTVANGVWAFVEKDGEEYFMKMFNSHRYPLDSAPLSEKMKLKFRTEAEAFIDRQRQVNDLLKTKSGPGGNFIYAIELFRERQFYYKVTAKVAALDITLEDISKLDRKTQLLIPLTLAGSLKIMHDDKVVHGDLKPPNVMITKNESGNFVTKLIDFDDGYFSSKPPKDPMGDQVYYSPELAQYILDKEKMPASNLTIKSDIFSFGLMIHQYLTGRLPLYDKERFSYAWEAVLAGEPLGISSTIINSTAIDTMLQQMLSRDFLVRPDVTHVREVLKRIRLSPDGITFGRPKEEEKDVTAPPKLKPMKGSSTSEPKKRIIERPKFKPMKKGGTSIPKSVTPSKPKIKLIKKKP